MNQSQDPIVGIDLGTTNSVVAALVDGQVKVLSHENQSILPSVVGLDDAGKLLTGSTAKNQLAAFPDRTIASVKRKMGSDEVIQLGDRQFTPPQISAIILKQLVERAALALGTRVSRAVITVPAFFDENQRQATREAGQLAGLTVERIINEPTAATLVYHAEHESKKHIVVYDFGGGTFDVSVVRIESGVVEVLTSKGDTQLGGDDIDQLLLDFVADKFQEQHGIDLRTDATTRYRLLQACETAKHALSQFVSTDVVEEFIAEQDGQPINLNIGISREQLDELILPLIERTMECLDEALRDVDITVDQIDDLVLVGGSTRIPLVEKHLLDELGITPSRSVDPDFAVALGAANQAAMLAGHRVGPVLVDVTSHSLGLEVIERGLGFPRLVSSCIIRRNSPLPATFEQSFSRLHDEQKRATITVLQGESSDPEENEKIGEFDLDIEAGSKFSDEIVVRFKMTLDGTLDVSARQTGTQRHNQMTIANALDSTTEKQQRDAAEMIDEMFYDSDQRPVSDPLAGRFHQTDPAHQASKQKPLGATDKYSRARSILEQCGRVSGGNADDLKEIQTLSEQLRQAMNEGNDPLVSELAEELDDVLFYVQG